MGRRFLFCAALAFGCGGGGDDGGSTTEPPGQTVRLTVLVSGGSSVEFYDNANVRHRCADATLPAGAGSCTATFVRGSEARIQRELSLPVQNESEWRLSLWAGSCLGLNANTEPRGGQCRLTMDTDKNVVVGFEKRTKVFVTQVLQAPVTSVRWQVAFSTQNSGGNPMTRGGTFDCNSPSRLPVCEFTAYYDDRTVLTLTAGSGLGPPANWRGWGGACSTAGMAPVCVITLSAADVNITGTWGGNF